MSLSRTASLFVLVLLLLVGGDAHAEDVAAPVWHLYVSAHYEEALTLLDRIETDATAVTARQTLREYRALCLLPLNQVDEASRVIGQIVDADPFYRPPADRRPPRFMAAFDQVRARRLPLVARDHYSRGAAAFDDGRFGDAESSFELALRIVSLAMSTDEADLDALSMLRTKATQFLTSSRSYKLRTQTRASRPPDTFDRTDPDVQPAFPIREEIPAWPSAVTAAPLEGTLELLITSAGEVRNARLVSPLHPSYDRVLLEAARRWTYRPATKGGRPVGYLRTLTVRVNPQSRATPKR